MDITKFVEREPVLKEVAEKRKQFGLIKRKKLAKKFGKIFLLMKTI